MDQKTVLITGATKGIGRATLERLHEKGYTIYAVARTQEDLEELVKDHDNVEIFSCDLSSKSETIALGEKILHQYSCPDILINNAGVFIPGSLTEEEDGALEKMMDTNLYSAYHLTRVFLSKMKERGSGHIFNMCSVASLKAYPNGGSYAISKYALLGFSTNLRHELRESSIKVTSVIPGATWSASWEGVELPEDRLMNADDVAIAISAALDMSPQAVMEDIVLRPQLGDL